MTTGTITLTTDSDAVTGAGTSFTAELTNGDFIVAEVGGISYTLAIKTVDSDTAITLVNKYTGPTMSGMGFEVVTKNAMSMVTAAIVVQNTEALRGLNYDKQNWQKIFSGTGNVTVKLPDNTEWTGPAWNSFTSKLDGKLDKNLVVGSVSGGAVIETGSNSNGRYIKHADGTMICTGNYTNVTTTDSVGGSYYRGSNLFTFPAIFSSVSKPVVVPTSTYVSGGVGWVHCLSAFGVAQVSVWYMCYQQGAIGSVNYIAIGRWK
jgi:hypothetical protein